MNENESREETLLASYQVGELADQLERAAAALRDLGAVLEDYTLVRQVKIEKREEEDPPTCWKCGHPLEEHQSGQECMDSFRASTRPAEFHPLEQVWDIDLVSVTEQAAIPPASRREVYWLGPFPSPAAADSYQEAATAHYVGLELEERASRPDSTGQRIPLWNTVMPQQHSLPCEWQGVSGQPADTWWLGPFRSGHEAEWFQRLAGVQRDLQAGYSMDLTVCTCQGLERLHLAGMRCRHAAPSGPILQEGRRLARMLKGLTRQRRSMDLPVYVQLSGSEALHLQHYLERLVDLLTSEHTALSDSAPVA